MQYIKHCIQKGIWVYIALFKTLQVIYSSQNVLVLSGKNKKKKKESYRVVFFALHVEPQKVFLRCRWAVSGCWSFTLCSTRLATWNYLFWRKVSLSSLLWCFWKQDTCNGLHDITLCYEGYGTALINFLRGSGSPRTKLNKIWLLLWL